MNEAQLAEIKRRTWYHRIDFGNGIVAATGTDPRQPIARMAIPSDLSGLMVADVGTRDGGLAFDFERRGATVIAADIRPIDFFNFKFARDCLGSRVRYLNADVYQLPFLDLPKFDIVNYQGVIYHVCDPLLSLMAVRHLCKPGGIVVVESAVLDGGFYEPGSAVPMAADDALSVEALRARNLLQYLPRGNVNSWVPSIAALEALCADAGLTVFAKKTWGRRCMLTTRNGGQAPRFDSFYEQKPLAALLATLQPEFQ